MKTHAVFLCPICEQEMIRVGFCHLVCPAGHYQEVCSDLFVPDRVPADPSRTEASTKDDAASLKDDLKHES